MPIVTYVSPFETFRGKVAGTGVGTGQVTYPVGNANYSRQNVIPANPESSHQVAIRALLTAVALGYKGLSAVNAATWTAAASGITRINAAGQEYNLSGPSLYSLINMYRTIDGEALLDTAPAIVAAGAVTSIDDATISGDNLSITFTHTLTQAVDMVLLRVTPDLGGNSRQARSNDYRIPTTLIADGIIAAAASPQTAVLDVTLFDLVVTNNIGIEVLPLTNVYYPGIRRRKPNHVLTAT